MPIKNLLLTPRAAARASSAVVANRSLRSVSTVAQRSSARSPGTRLGHTKRPRSRRLANRHNPSPSHQRILIRYLRRPRKTINCPENASSASCVCTRLARPSKSLRRSGTPHANHARAPLSSAIIASPPTPRVASAHRQSRGLERGGSPGHSRSCRPRASLIHARSQSPSTCRCPSSTWPLASIVAART